jgi:hypothetical protein
MTESQPGLVPDEPGAGAAGSAARSASPDGGDRVVFNGVRIRRCTFRRLTAVDVRGELVYDVECLYPERALAIPLGDLEIAMPVCNDCSAAHIFRPDED